LITGFNTDIKHNDRVYHIQTEDKGLANPYIESLVYVGGEILASKKTSYAEKVTVGAIDEKLVGQMMETQHKTMIAAIKRGRFDALNESQSSHTRIAAPPSTKTVAQSTPAPAAAVDAEKTLDQVILDYLASEAESEHLEMTLDANIEFVSGQATEFRVAAKKSLSQQPIVGAAVEVKIISTVEPPRVVFRGKTEADGSLVIRCSVPVFREGTAAVIVSAHSALGNDEVKQLVKRKK
jgi:hypothetical protein